ncbi:MAG: glycoside hydrolase family 9 protein, partial [Actinomycetota bacterium]|nr:glycoside hydrolase family 9 protein [Actinomycetota bacterium]
VVLLAVGGCGDAGTSSARTLVRVNQVGYPVHGAKEALLMASGKVNGANFTVFDGRGRPALRGRVGRSRGAWSRRWPHVYGIDLSRLDRPGRYSIRAGTGRSRPFAIVSGSAYRPLAANALRYFQAQRDGPDVSGGALRRRASHLRDVAAATYSPPRYRRDRLIGRLSRLGGTVDVAGGLFDAGDYLKFVETASFNEVMLLFALREYPSGVPDPAGLRAQARFGTDWLLKMWDPKRGVLYYQVGLGDGDKRSILGDHDLWRLPQTDDRIATHAGSRAYFLSHRPVFAANAPGAPISPNLAGRTAAAFALCAQVQAAVDADYARRCLLAGQTLFDRANTRPGQLLTTSPHSYYDEHEWRDDLELAAAELFRATRLLNGPDLPHPDARYYLNAAAHWADAYMASPFNGTDSLNLYDISALAHFELHGILTSPVVQQLERSDPTIDVNTSPAALEADLRAQLRLAVRRSARDPFGLANVSGNLDTVPHALGNAIAARLYDTLHGRQSYERLARQQLGWVLGANPWGSSFVVGAGTLFPRCPSHQVANLSGSLTGHGALLFGATVDGPTSAAGIRNRGAPDGYRRCIVRGLGDYDGRGLHYRDDVTVAASSEPTDDYAALALVASAQQAAR